MSILTYYLTLGIILLLWSLVWTFLPVAEEHHNMTVIDNTCSQGSGTRV